MIYLTLEFMLSCEYKTVYIICKQIVSRLFALIKNE